MQESPELRQERDLARRNWIGCLLTFAAAAIVIVLVTALPLGIFRAQSQPVWVLLLFALGGLVLTLVFGIGGMVLILRIASWSMEGARQRQRRGDQVLQHTLPGLAPAADRTGSKFSARELGRQLFLLFSFVVGISLTYFVVNRVLERMVPGAPRITSFVLTFALGALVLILAPSLLHPRPPAVDKQREPRQSRRFIAGILYILVVILPTFGVIPLIGTLTLPVLVMPVVALGMCVTAFMAANAVYALAPIFWIQSALQQCDYDRALARARRAADYSFMPGFYRNMAGVILLWAGRYEEAREMFQQSIGETRQEGMGAGSAALENIGCALAWQGQYAEAIKMFEGSIAISQDQVMVYSDLAETLLRQGTELPRALELTDRAVKHQQQASFESRLLARHQAGQVLATRAWALAASGRRAEALETLARAFAEADKSFKPVLAGVYWRAGQGMLALGERRRAEEHFAEGKRIDPLGHYGRACAEALLEK
ncbi:MAG: tetratricopeptide repeat protein [Acidobacteriota bacterium]